MGTVFSLYKRKPKQRYEVGKPRHGYAPGRNPPEKTLREKMKLMQDVLVSMKILRNASIMGPPSPQELDHFDQMPSFVTPGWAAMWSIMGGDGNYRVFKMTQHTRDELADILFRGSQNIDSMEDAFKVADHMLAWAGDDDVTLNPEEPDDLADLGWPTRGYRDAGSIWDAMQ